MKTAIDAKFTTETEHNDPFGHVKINFLNSPDMRQIYNLAMKIQELKVNPDDFFPKLFICGGTTRDGFAQNDIDIEIAGLTKTQIGRLIKDNFPEKSGEHGKIFDLHQVQLQSGKTCDIACSYWPDMTAEPPDISVLRLCSRRNFTCNAILFDPINGETYDPLGGRKDLENKILKACRQDLFDTEPICIFKGLQLASRLGLKLDSATEAAIRTAVSENTLQRIEVDQITQQFKKLLLLSPKPSAGLILMYDLGIIDKLYPELAVLNSTPQDYKWHPEGDVWKHTMLVLDAAAVLISNSDFDERQKLQIMLGALLHDIGKPLVTKINEGGRITSYDHEKAGLIPAKKFLHKHSFGRATEKGALSIVSQHMLPAQLYSQLEKGQINLREYRNSVRKILRDIFPLDYRVFTTACEADFRGRGDGKKTEPYNAGKIFNETVSSSAMHTNPRSRLLNGRNLELIGISDRIVQGKIIQECERLRDRGKFENSDEALNWVARKYFITSDDIRQAGLYEPKVISEIMKKIDLKLRQGSILTRNDAIETLYSEIENIVRVPLNENELVNQIRFSPLCIHHMFEPGRWVPPSLLTAVIKNGDIFPDPRNRTGTYEIKMPFFRRGKRDKDTRYEIEVIFRPQDLTILHFVYKRPKQANQSVLN